MKSWIIPAIALSFGVTGAFYSRRLVAQTPFNGARITYSDFLGCDPAVSSCTVAMKYIETTSADQLTRATVWSRPDKVGEDFTVLDTATEQIQIYPEVKEYFRMPRAETRQKRSVDLSPDCAASAPAMAVLVGHSRTAGYATADYKVDTSESSNTVSFARDLGCLILRVVYVWKGADPQHIPRPTWHVAVAVETQFADANLQIPNDIREVSPLILRHDVFVRRSSSGPAFSQEQAEADWQSRLKDGRLIGIVQQNDKWLARNAAKSSVQ